MKRQIGLWIDAELWNRYYRLCRGQKLHPSEPIKQFILFATRDGSPLDVLNLMRGIIYERPESLEDYADILLHWYDNGRTWLQITDQSETAIEPLLLQILKEAADSKLRKKIKEAILISSAKKQTRTHNKKNLQTVTSEPESTDVSPRIEQIRRHVKENDLTPERTQEILTKIHQIRQKLANKEKKTKR